MKSFVPIRFIQSASRCAETYPLLAEYVASLKTIPAGICHMGGVGYYESPVHSVFISEFAIGCKPVSVGLWKEYARVAINGRMPPEPLHVIDGLNFNEGWGKLDHPIVNVSWTDCENFISWATGVTGIKFDFPSEAQWEYAYRGGVPNREYPWGDFKNDKDITEFLGSNVWCGDLFKENRGGTASLNRKSRIWLDHKWGIVDMDGNVRDWCRDYFNSGWYKNPKASGVNVICNDDTEKFPYTDKAVPNITHQLPRVSVRGGSWMVNGKDDFRCSKRNSGFKIARYTDVGLRLCVPKI
jgi:formylglycine-generating enzyme required for sulfatase activity